MASLDFLDSLMLGQIDRAVGTRKGTTRKPPALPTDPSCLETSYGWLGDAEGVKRVPLAALGQSKPKQAQCKGVNGDGFAHAHWKACGCPPHPIFSPAEHREVAYTDAGICKPTIAQCGRQCRQCGLPTMAVSLGTRKSGVCVCRVSAVPKVRPLPVVPMSAPVGLPEPRYYRVQAYPITVASCTPVF